jgi:hypothetical protein
MLKEKEETVRALVARLARGERVKTLALYRIRFLGPSAGRLRPDLWVASVGDRRS